MRISIFIYSFYSLQNTYFSFLLCPKLKKSSFSQSYININLVQSFYFFLDLHLSIGGRLFFFSLVHWCKRSFTINFINVTKIKTTKKVTVYKRWRWTEKELKSFFPLLTLIFSSSSKKQAFELTGSTIERDERFEIDLQMLLDLSTLHHPLIYTKRQNLFIFSPPFFFLSNFLFT